MLLEMEIIFIFFGAKFTLDITKRALYEKNITNNNLLNAKPGS